MSHVDSAKVVQSPSKAKLVMPILFSNSKSRSLNRSKEVKGAGANSVSAEEQEK
jgi:hypothetical protein